MNIAKTSAAFLGAFTLSATLVHGQARTFFEDIKNFKQIGPFESEYLGGSWDITMIDGFATVLPCFGNNDIVFIPPVIGCSAGTTALVDQGDFDLDGLRDGGRFFSIATIFPAIQVEPFQTNLVELYAAPPSKLPRPLGGFNWVDNSVVLYYDIVNDPANMRGYEITRYTSSRPYLATELERHRDEIVPGVYIFKFPALGSNAQNPANFFVQVGHREMVEAYPGPGGRSVTSGGISVGNDFRLLNDDAWRNGRMEFDPRLVFRFEWEGFNPSTFLGGDRLFISITDRETGLVDYPPFPVGETAFPQLIGSSTLGIPTYFELGPSFFSTGDLRSVQLIFSRSNAAGNVTDASSRTFNWDVDFIDTYEGFIRFAFPAGVLQDLTTAEADFDGDGYTNLEEFALQTDVADPADVPNPTPTLDQFTEQCVLDIPKRPSVGGSLTYQVEYSTDLVEWITITKTDPNWFIEFDNAQRYRVRSKRPYGETSCLTRVKITQNN